MKDKLTQETDETNYLLSSEKNAARIKESMAQAGLIYCDIDEDGKITPIFTQEMADSNVLPNVGVEFEMRFSNDTSPKWQLYRMANLFDCGGFSVTFIDTGKTFCYAEIGAYGMEIRPSQADKGVHIDEDGDLAVGSEKVGVASQGFADSLEVGMKFMGMDETHTFTECVAIAILETSKGDSLVTYEYNDSCSVGTCWLLNEWVKPISNCGENKDTD